ncbi:YdcF family protein [Enterococcus viikkiensis]|uniref:YdcF family protein n=1 Tax=Enterococcus viikkiensis TaxID=930854 RepID=A0ABU3FNJ1_9ENTE|nr:YdcF family protein [Enterococcus viikkiensis]MDT2827277.1 YdcF family protein [Enterococcus viikkiensis]
MQLQRDLLSLALYLIGFIFILVRFKKKKLKHVLIWTGIFLILYFCFIEIREKTFYLLIPLFFFFLFYYFYFKDKCRLRNGWLFNLFLLSFMGYLVILTFSSRSLISAGILGVLILLFLFSFLFGIYAAIIFLIGNSFIVLRHESRRLPNLLTLILALAIIALVIIQTYEAQLLPEWMLPLLSIPTLISGYFFIVFWNFLSISMIYQFNQPKEDQDFIIILGAGLIDGRKVTPLLAQRINRGIQFYQQQLKETLSAPKLLMSGGQGPDEKVPEAVAMQEYAIEQGIPIEDILLEAQSTNTLENMKFSKEIMDRERPSGYHAIFTSNNYHIFPAGMYASQAGLKIDGIGSKTARYYWPNAFLREFIAVALMHKRIHLFVCGGIVVLGSLLTAASFISLH